MLLESEITIKKALLLIIFNRFFLINFHRPWPENTYLLQLSFLKVAKWIKLKYIDYLRSTNSQNQSSIVQYSKKKQSLIAYKHIKKFNYDVFLLILVFKMTNLCYIYLFIESASLN